MIIMINKTPKIKNTYLSIRHKTLKADEIGRQNGSLIAITR